MSGPIHAWFGLTYSAYLVLPRSLLGGMPIAWQDRMVELLDEMRATYDSSQVKDNYTVKLRGPRGRFIPDPLANYRRPPKLPYAEVPHG